MENRKCFYVDIRSNKEADGRLLVVESGSDAIPFEIKRIFWVRDVIPGAERGQHATKKTKLVLIAVAGSCDVVVHDGKEEKTYKLDDPTKGLYIDEMLWRTMKNFSSDCVVEAVCDHPYAGRDETYDDFDEYLKALEEQDG
ncbi:MAG: FdtA/QdtA family cupin domain-containing protein [Lachnospiraceae bacterium]|nr:FdtA/QdtA family cupin domain-containing protein [Lachnospiraceae bacterium]